jgi:transposase
MKKTNDKKEYRRAQAILKKGEGKTHKEIAKEHGVNERTTQRCDLVKTFYIEIL